jgi:hypothetical protein
MTPEFWVQLAAAVATFLAVLAALFLGFRDWFFPPVLVLRLVDPRGAPPATAFIPIAGQPVVFQTVSRWYHVRVDNKRRPMARATDTEVCLVAVGFPNAADNFVMRPTCIIKLKVRHEGIVRRNIGPSLEWDLCSVIR